MTDEERLTQICPRCPSDKSGNPHFGRDSGVDRIVPALRTFLSRALRRQVSRESLTGIYGSTAEMHEDAASKLWPPG